MKKFVAALCLCLLLSGSVCAGEKKYVALTFDDGPTGKYTQKLLDILEEDGITATFFLCGYRVSQYPELTERIAAQGHEIGLHGCSHAYFSQLSPEELKEELTWECYRIAEITGQAPAILRPPGGLSPKEYDADSVLNDFPVILWSVDPEDWAIDSKQTIVRRVVKKVKPGDIILLHDSSTSSVEAAREIISTLASQGYEFVTVSRLAEIYGTNLIGGAAYHYFREKEYK